MKLALKTNKMNLSIAAFVGQMFSLAFFILKASFVCSTSNLDVALAKGTDAEMVVLVLVGKL